MTGPVLLCFDGSDEAAQAIRQAGELLAGRDAIVLSVAVPANPRSSTPRLAASWANVMA